MNYFFCILLRRWRFFPVSFFFPLSISLSLFSLKFASSPIETVAFCFRSRSIILIRFVVICLLHGRRTHEIVLKSRSLLFFPYCSPFFRSSFLILSLSLTLFVSSINGCILCERARSLSFFCTSFSAITYLFFSLVFFFFLSWSLFCSALHSHDIWFFIYIFSFSSSPTITKFFFLFSFWICK